jgi:hypothetical protein
MIKCCFWGEGRKGRMWGESNSGFSMRGERGGWGGWNTKFQIQGKYVSVLCFKRMGVGWNSGLSTRGGRVGFGDDQI